MRRQYISKVNIPDKPGVYIFKDSQGRPLYIGRATFLRDRVKSYFAPDLIETRGPRIVDMVTRAAKLTFEKTDSVLEAIILESNLIKKYQPKYNVDERDDKSSLFIVITAEEWPRVFTVRERDWNKGVASSSHEISFAVKKIFGPYPHAGLANESLKILRKIFPFKDKKSRDPRHEAFYKAIGRSPKDEDESAHKEYLVTIRNLILFLEGKKTVVVRRLFNEMKTHAKNLEFEQANKVKRTIYALKHINDIALIKKTALKVGEVAGAGKMEAYDIAHLSGTNTVGAMVVSVGGELQQKEYRTFKMSRDTNNDLANLVELLSRRLNHSEWTYPDLIVVDGNENQKHAAEAVLSARRINIPVVAVTKDEKHKARNILGNFDDRLRSGILALNAEAHRFTIKYHRKRRGMI